MSLTDCHVWHDSACPPWAPPCKKPHRLRSQDVDCRFGQSRHQLIYHPISWRVAKPAAAERPFGSAISASSAHSPSLPPGSSETEPPVPSHYNTHRTQHALSLLARHSAPFFLFLSFFFIYFSQIDESIIAVIVVILRKICTTATIPSMKCSESNLWKITSITSLCRLWHPFSFKKQLNIRSVYSKIFSAQISRACYIK